MEKRKAFCVLSVLAAAWIVAMFPLAAEAAQPAVATDPALNVWGTTALLKGRVTAINSDPQGPGIIEYGFVWDTVSRGTPGNAAPAQSGYSGTWTTTPPYSLASLSYSTPAGTFPEATMIYYRAAAKNADGNWGYGDEKSFLTSPGIPVRTSPINGDYVTGQSITFQWNAVPGATSYVLHVRKGDVGQFFDQDVGNALSYTVPGFLNDGQRYRWSVTARNANSWFYEVPLWTVFNGPYPPPSVATVFPPADIESTSAVLTGMLTWTQGPAINRRGFVWDTVSRGDPGNAGLSQSGYAQNWVEDGNFGSGNFSHTITASPGIPIFYRAFARNDQGVRAYGSEQNFITKPPVPVPVCPIDGQNCQTMNHTTVRFQWEAAQGAAQYYLEIRKADDRKPFHLQEVGASTILDVQAKFPNDGTRFEWRIRAGNSSGWGNFSEWKLFTNGTLAAPSAGPTLKSPREGDSIRGTTIAFSWGEVAGAAKYQVQVSNQAEFGRVLVGHETTDTSTTVQNIRIEERDGTTIYWRVRAGNAAGWGPWSSVASFVVVPR